MLDMSDIFGMPGSEGHAALLAQPQVFRRKHGTAERWDVCSCDECLEGKEAAGLLRRPKQLDLFDAAPVPAPCVSAP